MNKLMLLFLSFLVPYLGCDSDNSETTSHQTTQEPEILYTMPEESEPHEATWLQWPHEHQYDKKYRNQLDATWVAMTEVLAESEKVHLIVYDETAKERVTALLRAEEIPLSQIYFHIQPTDDVWVRDNGPIYARDKEGHLVIQDWGFNGWGKKANYKNCDVIPSEIAENQHLKYVDLNKVLVNEGGSVEIDGHGTLMACKSSIVNKNRNPDKSIEDIEDIFTTYLGVTNFIWLEGKAGLEITDMHIDGFARFANAKTLITMNENDLLDWQVPKADIQTLYAAQNKEGEPYKIVKLPLTQKNVVTTYGKKLDYKGSYINYYIANNRVLVPNYNDPNDEIANQLIQKLYPNRTVVGIDVRNLYANGGMIHCVTQQQPR